MAGSGVGGEERAVFALLLFEAQAGHEREVFGGFRGGFCRRWGVGVGIAEEGVQGVGVR